MPMITKPNETNPFYVVQCGTDLAPFEVVERNYYEDGKFYDHCYTYDAGDKEEAIRLARKLNKKRRNNKPIF